MSDTAPSWTLDVERTLQVSEIHALFKQPISAIVEVSKDNEAWIKVAEIDDKQCVSLNLSQMQRARFMRYSFQGRYVPSVG